MANDVRLIDAKALCKGINESIKLALEWENEAREMKDTHGVKYAIATQRSLLSMMEMVLDEPTIDAQPVKHGKWVNTNNDLMPMHRYDEFTNPEAVFWAKCSSCNITFDQQGVAGGWRYCPHCGAEMRGGDYESNS